MYGMAQSIPDSRLIEEIAENFVDVLYTTKWHKVMTSMKEQIKRWNTKILHKSCFRRLCYDNVMIFQIVHYNFWALEMPLVSYGKSPDNIETLKFFNHEFEPDLIWTMKILP